MFFKLGHRFLSDNKEYILAAAGVASGQESSGIRLSMVSLETGKTIGTTIADRDSDGSIGVNLKHLIYKYRSFNLIDKDTMHPVGEIPLNEFSNLVDSNNDKCCIVKISSHTSPDIEFRILNLNNRHVYASGNWKKFPTLSEVQEIIPNIKLVENNND